eukprot:5873558-Lingulodinium_polyedra.AAC.1
MPELDGQGVQRGGVLSRVALRGTGGLLDAINGASPAMVLAPIDPEWDLHPATRRELAHTHMGLPTPVGGSPGA